MMEEIIFTASTEHNDTYVYRSNWSSHKIAQYVAVGTVYEVNFMITSSQKT